MVVSLEFLHSVLGVTSSSGQEGIPVIMCLEQVAPGSPGKRKLSSSGRQVARRRHVLLVNHPYGRRLRWQESADICRFCEITMDDG